MTPESADSWAAGEAYEAYMGRWSRTLASQFLAWLQPPPSQHWLELGCGTGALTAALSEQCQPASVHACDPSEAFIAYARRQARDGCTFCVLRSADDMPRLPGGFDAAVSGLVLNFIPEPARALAALHERMRPSAIVAAYVWDYVGGLEFLQCFWEEAVALDPAAAALDESQRFGTWDEAALASLFRNAALAQVQTTRLEVSTRFADFDDYWTPFLGATGPAPSYVASLDSSRRGALRARLERRLGSDGPITLRARAWAVRGAARA